MKIPYYGPDATVIPEDLIITLVIVVPCLLWFGIMLYKHWDELTQLIYSKKFLKQLKE